MRIFLIILVLLSVLTVACDKKETAHDYITRSIDEYISADYDLDSARKLAKNLRLNAEHYEIKNKEDIFEIINLIDIDKKDEVKKKFEKLEKK
ncbi:hypothetical protein [Paenibacillus sp. MDMC362]|uniref:hypothetical protein n=1 Tax=Paenibacillus sp. MDMC362 TaxID=2977365 RepID=UPI000DC598C3|nr:hypothetical protein [Paenibacillus sp. MDMC362]RAR45501.1 hypothetical protein DP091_04230 [Paenibacillus sp. MDMC362]